MLSAKGYSSKLLVFGALFAASVAYAGWFHKYQTPLTWFAGSGGCLIGSCIAFENNTKVGGFAGLLGTLYAAVVGGGLAHEIRTGNTGTTKRELWHSTLVERLNASTTLTSGHHELAEFLLGGSGARVHSEGHDFDLYRSDGKIQIITSAVGGKREGDALAVIVDESTDNGWPEAGQQGEAITAITTGVLNSHDSETGFCLRISNDNLSTAYAHIISVSNFVGQVEQSCWDDSYYS